ncbi:Proliferating cell nuclear antigen [Bienertia sinuspersici]
MAESSNPNPEKNMSFNLNAKNSFKTKHSIAALSDSDFNPLGVAMVDVNEKGFEITVRNSLTDAAGNLFLKSSGLNDFHCNTPIINKMINLNEISEILFNTGIKETISVFHLNGSNHLSFILGSAPTKEMSVEFLETDEVLAKFPDVEFSCEAGLKTSTLREMIDQLNKINGLQLVSVNIAESEVTIFVGLEPPWEYEIGDADENFEARLLTEDKQHHAWFESRHVESMKKASILATRFHLRFLTEPSKHVMMRFNLQELGELVFILKAVLIVKNPDRVSLDDDGAPSTEQLARMTSALKG